MGIPLPALAIRSPRFEGPLDQAKKVVQLKSLLQGQQLNQQTLQSNKLKLQQQQQAQKDQQLFRQAYMEAQGNPKKTMELATRAGVSPLLITKYRDSIIQSQKALADLDEAGLDNAGKRVDMLGSAFQAVLGLPENQRAQGYAQVRGRLIQGGVITAEQSPEQYPGNEFLQMGALSSVSSKDQIAAERQRRQDKETARHNLAMEGKPTTKERDFQTFYKAYRESKGLPRNAKIEMQARQAFAKQSRAGAAFNINFPSALKQVEPGQRREEILSQLDPSTRALIEGIVDYKIGAKEATSIRGGRRERVIGLAKLVDPTFDMSQYPARQRLRSDFFSGKGAANLRSLNTAIGHLDSLGRAADRLDNSSIQLWNKIANFTLAQTGDPRIVEFNNTANAVAGEMATIFKNTSGTDQEIKAWREQLSSSQSPEQIHGAIRQLIELMASRMEALAGQWQAGMGKPKDFRFLNDKSEKILREFGEGASTLLELDRIGEREAAGGVPGRAPSVGAGMVTMIAPDGSEAQVPRENVEAAIAAGARIKGQ